MFAVLLIQVVLPVPDVVVMNDSAVAVTQVYQNLRYYSSTVACWFLLICQEVQSSLCVENQRVTDSFLLGVANAGERLRVV